MSGAYTNSNILKDIYKDLLQRAKNWAVYEGNMRSRVFWPFFLKMGKTIAYMFADVNDPIGKKTMMQEAKPVKCE